MSGPAEVLFADRPAVFVADDCRVDGRVIHARGRWRFRVGPNHADFRYSEPRSYTWPVGRCSEIRWTSEVVA